jgi:thermitase
MNFHRRHVAVRIALTAFTIGALTIAGNASAAIRVHRPVFEPSLLRAGEAQQVRLTTFINHGATPVLNAHAFAHDERGRPTVLLGTLHDDGRDGDAYAGDQRFSLTLSLSEREPVVRTYSISADIEGLRDPIWSTAVTLEALPEEAPIGSAPPAFERGIVDPVSDATLACDGVLVYFAKGTDYAHIQASAERIGARVRGVAAMSDGNAWNFALPCTDLDGLTRALRSLSEDPQVQGAEPQSQLDLSGVPFNDPQIIIQNEGSPNRWSEHLGHTRSWNLTKGQRFFDPMVAIIDTGVDYRHEELQGRVTLGKDFVGINDFDPMDETDHGTGVAGIVGAITNNALGIVGGAPDTRMLAVRVGKNRPTTDHVCDGIEYATANGASILNLSLGGPLRSRRLAAAVDQAVDAGLLVIAAAGNRHRNKRDYPAGFDDTEYFGAFNRIVYHPHVISVGAIEVDGSLALFPSVTEPGSNYGSWVDLSAYGLASVPRIGTSAYDTGNGTSIAAPMVSAAAALVWSMDATLNGDAVRAQLFAARQPTGRSDPNGNVLYRLNTFTAVLRAGARRCTQCAVSPLSSILSDAFPSPGARINLGFSGAVAPAFTATNTQAISIHGVALPLLPRLNPLPLPLPSPQSDYAVQFSSDLRSFDAYNSQNGFFDLFAMTLGAPYFNLPLNDDVRPSINEYLALGGKVRLPGGSPVQLGAATPQSIELTTTAPLPFLSVVLDNQTLPDSDLLKPSWGTITLLDITPQRFE